MIVPKGIVEEAVERSREVGAKVRREFKAQGFGLHKDTYGVTAISLGHELDPQGFGVRASREACWGAAVATEEPLRVKLAAAEALEALLPTWIWLPLTCKPALAILCRAFGYIKDHLGKGGLEVPAEILQEFQATLFVSSFFVARMDLPRFDKAYMTDSRPEGGGVIQTRATVDELCPEARSAETRGWYAMLALDEEEDNLGDGSGPKASGPIPVEQGQVTVIHLFSGPRRKEDLHGWVQRLGEYRGIAPRVISVDIMSMAMQDMLNDVAVDELPQAFLSVDVVFIAASPPCSTWSRARFRRPGPAVLRTRCHLMGLPRHRGSGVKEVQDQFRILERVVRLCEAVVFRGGGFFINNPEKPGHAPYPPMCLTDQIAQLRWLADAVDVRFDPCVYGLGYRKPINLLAPLRVFARVCARCSRGREAHPPTTGEYKDGVFQTTSQSR